jgi:hypothetical protein
MPKKLKRPAAAVTLKSRKKKCANSTSFKPGNRYRFPEGTSGNSGGKPKTHRLLSKTLRATLSDPAPLAVAQAFGLGRNASWSQCIAARLVRQAVAADPEMALNAARLIGLLTEGARPDFDASAFDDDPASAPKLIELVFVESDGNGRMKTIEGNQPVLPANAVD